MQASRTKLKRFSMRCSPDFHIISGSVLALSPTLDWSEVKGRSAARKSCSGHYSVHASCALGCPLRSSNPAVVLIAFAVWFALNPAYGSTFVEFHSLNRPVDVLRIRGVLDDKLHHPISHSCISLSARPLLGLFTSDFPFSFGAAASSMETPFP